ncbi:MAG: hypothetical protein IKU39_01655 [Lachnospiraceae bacterium]|nr:hypothetical protein [Lachnospiraceae bacterium]
MIKMKHQLGVMDLYPIAANKTQIENNPFFQARLKEPVDAERLYAAVKQSLCEYPLFACTLRYERGYYLETNEKDFPLIHAAEENRPLAFGDATSGFLWQMCYDQYTISFEWCHAISDGRGGFSFFSSVLCHYFGVDRLVEPALELGLESFYNKAEKGIPQKKQEPGFAANALPFIKRGYRTDCHILKAPMSEVLSAAKKSDSSPAAVLPPLVSMVLRKHMNPKVKNKNVSCNVVIDCRGPMGFQTMHNCIISKNITYIDSYDTMDFALVSTIYRTLLDLAVQQENIVKAATETVDMIRPIVSVKPRFLQKALAKVVAGVMKHSESNFTFTYLGRMDLPEEVMSGLADFNFRSWTDFGECNVAAIDFGGMLILNICENYQDKHIIPDLIDICSTVGIHFETVDVLTFEQANLRLTI